MDISKEDDLRREYTAMIMGYGILDNIDKIDNPDWDKEYIKSSLRDWIGRRKHLI